ncbi:histone deacetylase [Mariniblastus sp.]|nr:histone deacetylase [Mariniblastus sp.]MDA7903998.1 histone deacetylase [Mariniblastus sp.]MDA7925233.1 histone deacetylase [Mariniblastus sp.]MDB4380136.1 histone deacetylase [Mariniblastus sp.]
MLTLKLFYSDTFELPLPDRHRFPMSKYGLLRERVLQDPIATHCELSLPAAATDHQLSKVHTPEYLEAICTGNLTEVQIRRIGFPWSLAMVERSRRSTGATIEAGFAALDDGLAGNLAGGTHHAFEGNGQGFCVFNDVCVAARVLQSEGRIGNVLVVDCDVHQGNGTSSIARGDASLFSFSMHCEKNFPFQKTNGDCDIALPAGTTDARYLEELEAGLSVVLDSFLPDFVFYLAGADPYTKDRLGLLDLSKAGLAARDRLVMNFCHEKGLPMAFAMAGGYAPEIDDIVDIHFQTVKIAVESLANRKLSI